MPPLKNNRHELFCLALAEGQSANQAYERAGYTPNDSNCIRLRQHPKVQARLNELQAEAAKKSEVTVQSLLAELEDARAKASSLDQLNAAVRAIEAKARVSGLLVQKIEQRVTIEDQYESAATADELCRMFALNFADDVILTDPELNQLADMLKDATRRMKEFVASCRAKPVNASAYSQRRTELDRRKLTNGSRRP
jgi:phage terminase small subunit